MVALFDLLDDRGQLALELSGYADAEYLADLVRRQPPEAQFAAALEDLVDREMAFEDEIAAVLDLGNGVWSENPICLNFQGLRSFAGSR